MAYSVEWRVRKGVTFSYGGTVVVRANDVNQAKIRARSKVVQNLGIARIEILINSVELVQE